MRTAYALLSCVLLVCASVPTVAVTGSADASASTTAPTDPTGEPPLDGESELDDAVGDESRENGSEARYGTVVSAFVQSNTAEARGTIDRAIWEHRAERRGSDEVADRRLDGLRDRFDALESDREALREEYDGGEISELQYRARLSRIDAQLLVLDAVIGSADEADGAGESTTAEESEPAAPASDDAAAADALGGDGANAGRESPCSDDQTQ
ncbi:DUF7096 domain-containing protein [Halegenticoccus tardaugens]|uniref:DUF7096 domain-containing protein n=1 Tax=Halegenticoccus tardaugens TaxID=2071624 RepID=UPI00100C28CA|nr:hypothetical protein [Halegenticoccus tardaugens]